MNAKRTRKLNLHAETRRDLIDRELGSVAGGITLRCTGTDFCTDGCVNGRATCLC